MAVSRNSGVAVKKANLHDAKTNLSQLVELAAQGEEVIICKAGQPVARLVAIHGPKAQRSPGGWVGKVVIKEDFDELSTFY